MITREKRGSRGEEENSLRDSVASYLLLVACMHLHPDSFSIDWGHTSSSPVSCISTLLHSALPISPFLSQPQPRGEGPLYTSTQPSRLAKNIGGKNFHSSHIGHSLLYWWIYFLLGFHNGSTEYAYSFYNYKHFIDLENLFSRVCSCCFAV